MVKTGGVHSIREAGGWPIAGKGGGRLGKFCKGCGRFGGAFDKGGRRLPKCG
jgi:hypothetical protein